MSVKPCGGVKNRRCANLMAYAIADLSQPIPRVNNQPWIILRIGLGIVGKDRCLKGIPKRCLSYFPPTFTMVAADRKSAIHEITCRLNDLFDALDRTEELDALKKGK